jgi:ABC-type sugar transport system permease subunit
VVIFLAGLQGIPQTLLEAVNIDGGTAWHSFRHVVLPLMSPLVLYNLIIGLIRSLQLFTEPYIMTGGRADECLSELRAQHLQLCIQIWKNGRSQRHGLGSLCHNDVSVPGRVQDIKPMDLL